MRFADNACEKQIRMRVLDNACELYCAHVITCMQIGIALRDFMFVAPESQERFINATKPKRGMLANASRNNKPYSIPAPYIGSVEPGKCISFGRQINL